MSSTNISSVEECGAALLRWKEGGTSNAERSEFVDKALLPSANDRYFAGAVEDVSAIAKTAMDVFRTFDEVLMWWCPQSLIAEWGDLKFRYIDAVKGSLAMAATDVDVFQRFDEVYMAKVETIETEEDRLAAIDLLGPFIAELETNDQSNQVSREFLELKRDVEAFINGLDGPSREAADAILADIQVLEGQIQISRKTLAGTGASLVATPRLRQAEVSPVIALLEVQRDGKVESLSSLRKEVTLLNGLVNYPRHATVQTEDANEIPTPNIGAMLDGLTVFAELWAGLRSQTEQFHEHIQGGLDAATNLRFKAEIRLAREGSRPLRAGLVEYIEQLDIWAS